MKRQLDLPAGLFRDLALWVAEGCGGDEAVAEQPLAAIEAIITLYLLKAGWDSASVAARASSYARLFIWKIINALQAQHQNLQPATARRVRRIAATARKLHDLKKPKVVRRHAAEIADQIWEAAPAIERWLGYAGSASAERVAELFEQAGKGEIDAPAIKAGIESLDHLACECETRVSAIREEMDKLEKTGRPMENRVFGYQVELLAQEYVRRTGKAPRDEVRQIDGRPQGEFFKIVDTITRSNKRRPKGREGLKKAITRALDRSPRVPR